LDVWGIQFFVGKQQLLAKGRGCVVLLVVGIEENSIGEVQLLEG
jgi:hypothetical protein